MNKTAIKIFTFFILLASGISILLLLINFFSFSMTAADTAKIYPDHGTDHPQPHDGAVQLQALLYPRAMERA